MSFRTRACKQYLGSLETEYVVFKNDEVTVAQIEDAKLSGILVSPGPGTPEESGISLETVEKLGPKFPLFGVCMGHQCIGQVFGGKPIPLRRHARSSAPPDASCALLPFAHLAGNITRAKCGVMHGKTSPVFHTDTGILKGLSR